MCRCFHKKYIEINLQYFVYHFQMNTNKMVPKSSFILNRSLRFSKFINFMFIIMITGGKFAQEGITCRRWKWIFDDAVEKNGIKSTKYVLYFWHDLPIFNQLHLFFIAFAYFFLCAVFFLLICHHLSFVHVAKSHISFNCFQVVIVPFF